MTNETSKPKALIVTAWVFLLLASGLPRIIAQEIFYYQSTENMRLGFTLGVILAGFALTFVWSAMWALRPLFILFIVLAGLNGWFIQRLTNCRSIGHG